MASPTELCSMCEEAPATERYGLPVCTPCLSMLVSIEGDLKEMEAADPALKELGERVEDACRRFATED